MSLLDCQPKDPEMMAAMEEQLEARLQKAGRELIERDRARYVLLSLFLLLLKKHHILYML